MHFQCSSVTKGHHVSVQEQQPMSLSVVSEYIKINQIKYGAQSIDSLHVLAVGLAWQLQNMNVLKQGKLMETKSGLENKHKKRLNSKNYTIH